MHKHQSQQGWENCARIETHLVRHPEPIGKNSVRIAYPLLPDSFRAPSSNLRDGPQKAEREAIPYQEGQLLPTHTSPKTQNPRRTRRNRRMEKHKQTLPSKGAPSIDARIKTRIEGGGRVGGGGRGNAVTQSSSRSLQTRDLVNFGVM